MIDEVLRVRPAVLVAIEAHARSAEPEECCGLLVSRDGCLEEAVPAQNAAADRLRQYEIDPRDYLAVIKRCRGTAAIPIGAYHSHPRSAAEPSPTDRASAFSDFLYVIAGPVAPGRPCVIRAYQLADGNFRPVTLVPEAEEPQP